MSKIIKSYGLRWKEQDVFWGKGRNAGTLLGVPTRARTSDPIDFRDQAGIYVLYSGHKLLYVGQAGSGNARLFSRLKKHRRDSLAGRWDTFSWFGLRGVLSKGKLSTETLKASANLATALNHIEAVLIASAEPTLNKQGGRFGGKDVSRYLQVRDDHLGVTEKQMIQDIWDQLEN